MLASCKASSSVCVCGNGRSCRRRRGAREKGNAREDPRWEESNGASVQQQCAVQRWKTGVKPFSSGHRRKKEKGSAALFAVASPAAATAYSLVEEKECVVGSFEKML